MPLAPVALFAFKRADHVRRALASLAANPELARSELHVFCDGPRGAADVEGVRATREAVRALAGPGARIVEREKNLGLARSLVGGVTELCERHGRVIVVEDDLVLAPTFLRFMNDALDRYEGEARVFQVSGHMFPVALPTAEDAVFLPFITSWGWATWARAWRHLGQVEAQYDRLRASRALRRRFDLGDAYPYFSMLRRQVRGEIDSWAIRWYATVFQEGGVAVYPRVSLVANTGFDGSGTHAAEADASAADAGPADAGYARAVALTRLPPVADDPASFDAVRAFLRRDRRLLPRILRRLRRLASRAALP